MKNFYRKNIFGFFITIIWIFSSVISFASARQTTNLKYLSAYNNFLHSSIYEDSILKTPGLLRKYKYPVEVHNVTTEDGYILEIHRLPNPGRQPVYVQHGLASSSAEFVFYGPKEALAYILYDEGYDVWLGNHRGNRYSKHHVTLNERDAKFWDYSLTELGKYDLKASIDHVINVTKFEKIHYIGNSQGCAVILILCDALPEYSDKIIEIQAMVPAVYIKHMKSPLAKFAMYLMNRFKPILPMFKGQVLQNMADMGLSSLLGLLCHDGAPTQAICGYVLSLTAGFNMKETNKTMLPVLLNHYPCGASMKQLLHFKQLYESGEFKQFDYGPRRNLEMYGQKVPPFYDIKKTKTKVTVYHSSNDALVVNKDVENFYSQLARPVERILYDDYDFNHINFIAGNHLDNFYYNYLIKKLKSLDNGL